MARDRQLPSFLARVHRRTRVPANATFLVAVVSLGLGIWMSERTNGITELVGLINFGAMTAFLALHVSVIWWYVGRQGSGDWWRHLIGPAIGFLVLAAVVYNAKVAAQVVGGIWFGVGVLILIGLYLGGRRPSLSGLATEVPTAPDRTAVP